MFSKSKAVVCVALSAAMLLGLTEIEGTGASAATAATGSAIVTTGSAVTTLEPVVSPEPTPVVDTSKIKLSKKTMNLMAGKKITLKVTGTTSTVTWTSSDESVATVSDKGVVKGIKKGSTEVQASVDGIKLTCKVSVVAKMSKKDFDRFGITEARYVRGKRKVTVRKINFIYARRKDMREKVVFTTHSSLRMVQVKGAIQTVVLKLDPNFPPSRRNTEIRS